MEKYKSIIYQYCPVLLKNVAIEKKAIDNNDQQYTCLNLHECKCENGVCNNSLILHYRIGK